MIGQVVDEYFPIRDKNNQPTYRPHQRETIIKTIEAFNNKKFVCLDGPVGCGKSAINYTVGMVLGDATYLTHQKQLQDQVAKENWPEVKVVKGRGSYCCNGATTKDDRIRCNYSGEQYETCTNSNKKASHGFMTEQILIESIESVRKTHSNNGRVFRMRTGFELGDDIQKEFDLIRNHTSDPETGERESAYSLIGCNVRVCECPVKSTRLLAKLHKIRILNPDVFYMLNRTANPYLPHSNLMIIDECHKIENIVERIFGGYINVEFIKRFFGIDLTELYECKDISSFVEKYMYLMKTVVLPAKCAAMLVVHMAPLMYMKHIGGDNKFTTLSSSRVINAFRSASHKLGNSQIGFSMKGLLNSVFTGDFQSDSDVMKDVWVQCREQFLEYCAQNSCDQIFDGFNSMCNSDNMVDVLHRISWYTESIEHLEDIVGMMGVSTGCFMFSQQKRNMWTEYEDSEVYRFVKEQIPSYRDAEMTSIKLTPINIPSMMNSFFYNKADHVLLSTGTWVDKENAMKTFGVNPGSVEFISIPTTFDKNRRPVYIIRNNQCMDFTNKEDGKYVYKSLDGSKMFTRQLGDIVRQVREYHKRKNNLNINIIVHTFSFDISKRVAQFCPYVDDSWLIQIGRNNLPIRNEFTGHTTSYVYKDELMQKVFDNKNSGLTFVSPSVAEGVDFKYDIARAQIILKRPTPNIGDPYINAQYKGNPQFGIPRDPNYLDRTTFIDILQMYGRIMRAEDDWGDTIVYDQALAKSFNILLSKRGGRKAQDLGLDYFVSAVKGGVGQDGFPWFEWPYNK